MLAVQSNETGVFQSHPAGEYTCSTEATVVNLAPDGLPDVPVFGELHYTRKGSGTTPHVHPGMIEILYCRRGADVSFRYSGDRHPFLPGEMIVAQPDIPHCICNYPNNLLMDMFWFRLPRPGRRAMGLTAVETRWLTSRLKALPMRFTADGEVRNAFRRLWQTYSNRQNRVERRLLLREAALHLLLRVIDSSANGIRIRLDVALEEIIGEMRTHPEKTWSVDLLMRRLSASAPKLTAMFKRRTGLPPHAFLMSCRLAAAKEALSTTSQRVGAIAYKLGFPSSQHFATQFRRDTGMTPLDWRCRHQAQ